MVCVRIKSVDKVSGSEYDARLFPDSSVGRATDC